MKILLFIAGIAAGFFGGAYAFPTIAPRLGLGMEEDDLLKLAPLPSASRPEAPTPGAPAKPAEPEDDPTPSPAAPQIGVPELDEPGAGVTLTPRDKAAARNRQVAGLWVRQGNALSRRGEHRKAAAAYEAALRLSPREPVALRNLGATYSALGEREKAIRAYRTYVKFARNRADALAVQRMLEASGVSLKSPGRAP